MAKTIEFKRKESFTDIDLQIMLCNEKIKNHRKIYRKSEKNDVAGMALLALAGLTIRRNLSLRHIFHSPKAWK